MPHLPSFRVVVTGSDEFTDKAAVWKALTALLARKLRSHKVTLLCGFESPGRMAGRWAAENGVAREYLPEPFSYDPQGTSRNTAILNDANAIIAFRTENGWSEAVDNLVMRANAYGRIVRVVEGRRTVTPVLLALQDRHAGDKSAESLYPPTEVLNSGPPQHDVKSVLTFRYPPG